MVQKSRLRQPDQGELQQLVNRMTGWQRHQWAKAGYPGAPRSPQCRGGFRAADPEVRPFTVMPRRRAAVAGG